ncbi:unnamed protein product, partial [Haemonchus placei]|uniref:G_PROTEIN_RECEP_F1_2 domain-containing protein n=1 Tax=Haemonchus placei TaxID=6290 RepID=A0A0N4WT12_HAEPC
SYTSKNVFGTNLCAADYYRFSTAGPYVLVIVSTMVNTLLTVRDETPVSSICLTRDAVNPEFYSYILVLRIICISISALIYVVILTKIKKRLLHMERRRHSPGYSAIGFLKRSTVTFGLTTANAVVFLLIPDVIKVTGFLELAQKRSILLYSLSMTNVILNAFILFFRHREIRNNIKRLFQVLQNRKRWMGNRVWVVTFSRING